MFQKMLQGGSGSGGGFRFEFGGMASASDYQLSTHTMTFTNLNAQKATIEINLNTSESTTRTWEVYVNGTLVKTVDSYANRVYEITNITPSTIIKLTRTGNSGNQSPGFILFE